MVQMTNTSISMKEEMFSKVCLSPLVLNNLTLKYIDTNNLKVMTPYVKMKIHHI